MSIYINLYIYKFLSEGLNLNENLEIWTISPATPYRPQRKTYLCELIPNTRYEGLNSAYCLFSTKQILKV